MPDERHRGVGFPRAGITRVEGKRKPRLVQSRRQPDRVRNLVLPQARCVKQVRLHALARHGVHTTSGVGDCDGILLHHRVCFREVVTRSHAYTDSSTVGIVKRLFPLAVPFDYLPFPTQLGHAAFGCFGGFSVVPRQAIPPPSVYVYASAFDDVLVQPARHNHRVSSSCPRDEGTSWR